ncbi:dehydrogenase/reductase SDR family member 1 [Heptranchias perlo]|uniref:dehydrogenase/reductase SDR family member 1 n=1 Tax=Heptranchias perlo TaxID=212740 RepID=UPI00355A1329
MEAVEEPQGNGDAVNWERAAGRSRRGTLNTSPPRAPAVSGRGRRKSHPPTGVRCCSLLNPGLGGGEHTDLSPSGGFKSSPGQRCFVGLGEDRERSQLTALGLGELLPRRGANAPRRCGGCGDRQTVLVPTRCPLPCRGHYICSVYAAQMMVETKRGLIVIISSMGGLQYLFNVAYGVGKAGCDRLAADCAQELRRHSVSCVSLWPGAVRTETVTDLIINREVKTKAEQLTVDMFTRGETPEMSGKCIVALATDMNLMKKSGKVLMTCDLAEQYGIKDVDGRSLVQYRSLKFLLQQVPGVAWLAPLVPGFIKVPKWVMALAASKF